MKYYTDTDVLASLRHALSKSSYRALADAIGCSAGFLCHIVQGRRAISDETAAYLGFEAVVQPRKWARIARRKEER